MSDKDKTLMDALLKRAKDPAFIKERDESWKEYKLNPDKFISPELKSTMEFQQRIADQISKSTQSVIDAMAPWDQVVANFSDSLAPIREGLKVPHTLINTLRAINSSMHEVGEQVLEFQHKVEPVISNFSSIPVSVQQLYAIVNTHQEIFNDIVDVENLKSEMDEFQETVKSGADFKTILKARGKLILKYMGAILTLRSFVIICMSVPTRLGLVTTEPEHDPKLEIIQQIDENISELALEYGDIIEQLNEIQSNQELIFEKLNNLTSDEQN